MHGRTYVLIVIGIVALLAAGIAFTAYMYGGSFLGDVIPALRRR